MTATVTPRRTVARALAFAGDTHTITDIQAGVESGGFQEWSAGDSVLITEIRDTPNARFLHLFLAEGHLTELRSLAEVALQWGREQGCTRASFIGRFGWLRSFVREMGFEDRGVYMEARL